MLNVQQTSASNYLIGIGREIMKILEGLLYQIILILYM